MRFDTQQGSGNGQPHILGQFPQKVSSSVALALPTTLLVSPGFHFCVPFLLLGRMTGVLPGLFGRRVGDAAFHMAGLFLEMARAPRKIIHGSSERLLDLLYEATLLAPFLMGQLVSCRVRLKVT
jgi:hypothetical protein